MDIFKIAVTSSGGFEVTVSSILIIISFIVLLTWGVYRFKYYKNRYAEFEINEAEIGIGNHKIKIKPNDEDLQIAYQLWVELSTRKIGLEIDEENDVIVELYNSWYEFFRVARELMKSIPVRKVRANTSTKEIIELSFKILNESIRPHLTKWQAKYRKWYQNKLEQQDSTQRTPQEIQRSYSEYSALIMDMVRVNKILISYKEMLEKLIHIR